MKRTTQIDWPALLLITAILLGGLARFMPAFVTRFPINDGGMFYTMTQELSANGYALPAATAYNGLDLPYAYPPLGFYLASFLADFGRIPLLGVFLWLPPLLATLTIPAFYLLARALLKDDLRAALAAVFFALTPGGYGWHIMGGGITRSLGLVFLLLATFYVLRLFQEGINIFNKSQFCFEHLWPSSLRAFFAKQSPLATWGLLRREERPPRNDGRICGLPNLLFPAVIFCSLAVLSHPEIAIQTAGLCAVIWLFCGRTRRGTLHAALVSLGVLVLTAPWWGTVLAQHGLAPFLSASQTGLHTSASWSKFFTDNFTLSGVFPFLVILRVIGLGCAFFKRQWLLLVLLVVPYLVDPRSAPAVSYLGFNLLSALAFLDAIPYLVGRARKSQAATRPLLEARTGVILLFALVFLQFLDCGLFNYRLINTTLTPADRQALAWARENLPPASDFLLVTTKPFSMSDPLQEWFPTLTGLRSQTTLQGLEWTLGGNFMGRLKDLAALQSCADLACVETWSARTGLAYDYLWITIVPDSTSAILAEEVRASADYRIVYESDAIVIFEPGEK